MSTGRFDPAPDKPYGVCETCGIELAAYADMRAHLSETHAAHGKRSHRVKLTNLSRGERIDQAVSRIVDDRIEDAMNDIERLVTAGDITDEEAATALRCHSNFHDAWQEYIEEDEGDAA